ncbi:TolC family outer membrane protein [Alteromonas sp. 14N.309.X.WAT.G.H12]|uniref:TolC family outer membrane protein n=1 Tax=Alteromonas sp. 14N.309.X.WAT.G.H12 TaxID=3120824 RepID=UPI002FD732E5
MPHDLQHILSHAIDNNPDVQRSWRDFMIAGEDKRQVEAGWRPSVDVSAGLNYLKRNYGIDRSYVFNDAQITVSQLLFDGFFTSSEIQRFNEARKVRYFELLATIENTAFEVVSAYADVQQFRELLIIAEENLTTHVSVFKQIEESVNAGVARRADLEQISGRLSLAESNVMTAQANLHDVSARFLRLAGILPPERLVSLNVYRPVGLVDVPLQSIIYKAYEHNPTFLAAYFDINAQQFAITAARSNYYPKVNVVASYGSQNRDDDGLDNRLTEGSIGLQLTYNLYNGGRDRSRVRAALFEIDRAKDVRESVCRDIRQTLQISYNEIKNLEQRLPALNEHRLSSRRVRTAYLDQFKIGQRTLLDLLDAENEAYESSRAYREAFYAELKAYFSILSTQGGLTSKLKVNHHFSGTKAYERVDKDDPQSFFDPQHVCPALSVNPDDPQQSILTRDTDHDGVVNLWDDCVNTPVGVVVNNNGCEAEKALPAVPDVSSDLLGQENVRQKIIVNVPFSPNSSNIEASYEVLFFPIVEALERYPQSGVIIEGHASLDGSAVYNKKLSKRRALSVVTWLVDNMGVPANRIIGRGVGEERPLQNSTDLQSNTVNRRIEALIVDLDEHGDLFER